MKNLNTKPIIYQKQTKSTYLYFIKENFALIKKLLEEKKIVPLITLIKNQKDIKYFINAEQNIFRQ